MQPVHAVDAHWPMVDLAVEVTLAQQRRLTLVETYVLRAFSEINGVTVSEIEQNLGLDLQIIKTVMMNLKQCRAIEYGTRAAEVDEDLRRVRQELGTVNDTLLASGLTDEQRKVQVARRDLLKAEEEALVENIEENPRVDWSQRSATLTTDGKQALLEGIIKEPTDLKIYRFARCLVTGVLHRLNSKSLPAHSLRPVHEGAIELDQITNTWALEKKHMEEASISSVGGLPWFPQLQARRAVDLAEKKSAICFKKTSACASTSSGMRLSAARFVTCPPRCVCPLTRHHPSLRCGPSTKNGIPRTGLLGWRPTCNRTLWRNWKR